MPDRPQKITFAEVRESGVHGCSCAAPTIAAVIRSPHWPDDLRPRVWTRRTQFLTVVVTDGLGAAAVNCPNGDEIAKQSETYCGSRPPGHRYRCLANGSAVGNQVYRKHVSAI